MTPTIHTRNRVSLSDCIDVLSKRIIRFICWCAVVCSPYCSGLHICLTNERSLVHLLRRDTNPCGDTSGRVYDVKGSTHCGRFLWIRVQLIVASSYLMIIILQVLSHPSYLYIFLPRRQNFKWSWSIVLTVSMFFFGNWQLLTLIFSLDLVPDHFRGFCILLFCMLLNGNL